MSKETEICLEILKETDKAFWVSDDGGENRQWIPKSQVETDQDCGPGDTVVFTMPEWLATEKGFI